MVYGRVIGDFVGIVVWHGKVSAPQVSTASFLCGTGIVVSSPLTDPARVGAGSPVISMSRLVVGSHWDLHCSFHSCFALV